MEGSITLAEPSTLAVITTSPYQVVLFLRTHLARLPERVTPVIFTNTEDPYRDLVEDLELRHIPIGRDQHVTPADVRAGRMLRRQLHDVEARSVVTMSPKGGFVGQLAARSAGVPRRLHIFTGQVWEGLPPGPKRLAVMAADRTIATCATHLAADSESQAANLLAKRIVPRGRGVAVPPPHGSIRGVDIEVFRPRPELRTRLRTAYDLTDDAVAFVQLGRIAEAKGIAELLEAFGHLRSAWRNGGVRHEPRLFLVGPDEGQIGVEAEHRDGVHVLGFTEHPEEILAAMDVLVLASHREGFGSTIIEAAAVGLPAVGTDIVGIRDAIAPGETGWLVPRRSPDALYAVLADILRNRSEARARGMAAMQRARRDFAADLVSEAWARHLLAIHDGVL